MLSEEWELFENAADSEIRVKRIRVSQGLGVLIYHSLKNYTKTNKLIFQEYEGKRISTATQSKSSTLYFLLPSF